MRQAPAASRYPAELRAPGRGAAVLAAAAPGRNWLEAAVTKPAEPVAPRIIAGPGRLMVHQCSHLGSRKARRAR